MCFRRRFDIEEEEEEEDVEDDFDDDMSSSGVEVRGVGEGQADKLLVHSPWSCCHRDEAIYSVAVPLRVVQLPISSNVSVI